MPVWPSRPALDLAVSTSRSVVKREREIGTLLPNNQRQCRTCYALCDILYPVSAAHTSIFRMDSNSTSYVPDATHHPLADSHQPPEVNYIEVLAPSISPAGSTSEVYLLLDFSILENGHVVHFGRLVVCRRGSNKEEAMRPTKVETFGLLRCKATMLPRWMRGADERRANCGMYISFSPLLRIDRRMMRCGPSTDQSSSNGR